MHSSEESGCKLHPIALNVYGDIILGVKCCNSPTIRISGLGLSFVDDDGFDSFEKILRLLFDFGTFAVDGFVMGCWIDALGSFLERRNNFRLDFFTLVGRGFLVRFVRNRMYANMENADMLTKKKRVTMLFKIKYAKIGSIDYY